MTISLAFLAPDLVKAAIDGRLPHGIGSGPPLPTCPRNGLASARCLVFPCGSHHIGPVFIQDRSASGKRDSSAQRQTAQNRLQARNGLRGDRNAAARARQLRALWPSPGNLAVRKSAWWAREDSNLQPDRYERSALTVELRARRAQKNAGATGPSYNAGPDAAIVRGPSARVPDQGPALPVDEAQTSRTTGDAFPAMRPLQAEAAAWRCRSGS